MLSLLTDRKEKKGLTHVCGSPCSAREEGKKNCLFSQPSSPLGVQTL